MTQSVLHKWVSELPLMQQSVLLSALRGADGLTKHNPAKQVLRCLRKVICVDAQPTEPHSFLAADEEQLLTYVQAMIEDVDMYPIHFYLHLMYATEVVGYKHPSPVISDMWLHIYKLIVWHLHLNVETKEQMDKRLNF